MVFLLRIPDMTATATLQQLPLYSNFGQQSTLAKSSSLFVH